MMKIWLIAVAAALFASAAPSQAVEPAAARYTVLLSGHHAGHLVLATAPDGQRCADFDFNDRGRGPVMHACTMLDPDGLPSAVTASGVDYLKVKFDEQFRRDASTASWSSQSESGKTQRPGFYVAYNGTSADLATLARALLRAPGQALDLLPAGHATLEEISERSVAANGVSQTVTLYMIGGLGFTPTPIWLDTHGELFMEGDTWFKVVPEGWESAAAGLIEAQHAAVSERAFAVAKTLQHRPEHDVAIIHAKLFDPASRRVKPDTTVVARGERIVTVVSGKPAKRLKLAAGTEIVDAHGKTLIPGLFDMHVHIASDSDGTLDLLNGITTVRDLGDDMDELLERRARYADGRLIGPRILLGGLMDGKGPLHGPTKVLIGTADEAHAAVKMFADHGYDQIKIYSSFPPELVRETAADAHARGMRVSGHIPAGMIMSQAIEQGYDEVQHANFWVLNFLGPDVTAKTNGMARFTEAGAHAKDLDLSSPAVKAFVALLQAHKTVVDPTLVAFEPQFIGGPRDPAPSLAPVISRLPPQVARGTLGGQLWKTEEERAAYRASYEKLKQFLLLLHRSGIRIVPGTDGMAGFELAHELETYVAAGLPPAETLYLATLGSASVMKREKELGSIAPGKLADMVLIDGDPVRNISDIRKVRWVMKAGVSYAPEALARSIGVSPP